MELAHSLLLNEEALQKIPDNKKPVFVFEWLRFLDKVLSAAQKVRLDQTLGSYCNFDKFLDNQKLAVISLVLIKQHGVMPNMQTGLQTV